MVTPVSFVVKCGLCGQEAKQHHIASYSIFGAPDLDDRPARMLRGTMFYWVSECDACGYIRDRLDQPCEFDEQTLNSFFAEIEACYDWQSVLEPRIRHIKEHLQRNRAGRDSMNTDLAPASQAKVQPIECLLS